MQKWVAQLSGIRLACVRNSTVCTLDASNAVYTCTSWLRALENHKKKDDDDDDDDDDEGPWLLAWSGLERNQNRRIISELRAKERTQKQMPRYFDL